MQVPCETPITAERKTLNTQKTTVGIRRSKQCRGGG